MGWLDFMQESIAIDLGTANTLIIHNDQVVVDEPSIVAKNIRTGEIVAIGKRAQQMHGKTHKEIETLRPLKDGVIADFQSSEQMIRGFIAMIPRKKSIFSPALKMVICIPSGVTEVEKRAVIDSAEHAGAKMGEDIIRQLIQKWSTQQSNFVKVFIVLKNADFGSYMMFQSFLSAQTVSGIRNAYSKSLNDGVAEYEVEFEGKAMDLAMGLSQTIPDGLNFKVTGMTGNRITAEIVQ